MSDQDPGPSTPAAPGVSLLDQPVLVVNQKAKLIELTNEFKVFDKDGTQIGAVMEVGQSKAKKMLRLVSNLDQYMTHKFEVRDSAGNVLLQLTRPRKVLKSTVLVSKPDGTEIGKIKQENMIGKIHFGLEVGDQRVGAINAENWRAWNFAIVDESGKEIARVTKKWEGLVKAAFTTADNYVVEVHAPLQDPMRSMVVAAALTIDTALKQDER
jgi:uncharacterized protein YxjI